MPGERSLFRKMQAVIDVAKSVKVASTEALCQEIEKRGITMFNVSRYDVDRDAFVSDISLSAIRRAVMFCEVLNLLSSDGSLTIRGREAARKTRYSGIVGDQVRSVLASSGVKLAMMNSVIREKLHADHPVLPTAEVLWNELQPTISRGKFAKMLTLLIHCERGRSSQAKVYLGFS